MILKCFGIDKYYLLFAIMMKHLWMAPASKGALLNIQYYKADKLHGFMMYGVIWAVGLVLHKNDYYFHFSNVCSSGITSVECILNYINWLYVVIIFIKH